MSQVDPSHSVANFPGVDDYPREEEGGILTRRFQEENSLASRLPPEVGVRKHSVAGGR